MAESNIYKNHPYEHASNIQGQKGDPYAQYPEMAEYINGAKYHGSMNQTIIGLSKTHGMNIDGINGMKR